MSRFSLRGILCAAVFSLILAETARAQPLVTGTVLGPDDRPLSGARAELLLVPALAGAAAEPVPVAVATTDGAGRFKLEAPATGLWRVRLRSEGGSVFPSAVLPLVEPLELAPASLGGAGAASPPEPPAARPQNPPVEPRMLSGQVVDATDRKPVPGALVWASADPGAFVRTDAAGKFLVAAPGDRRFTLEIVAPGHLLKRSVITRPQLVSGRAGTLALAQAGRLRGKVVDPRGLPVAGAAVVAIHQDSLGARAFSPSDPVADRTVTDAQGRFELRRVRTEQGYEIRASRSGAFPAAQRITVGDAVARARDLTFVLAPARPARGKVQDPAGRPIVGAEVVVRPAFRPGSPAPAPAEKDGPPAVQSDAQGVFALPELPASEVELSIRRKGYAPVILPALRIAVGTGAADLGTVTLRPGTLLTGRVVDLRGQAVPGGEIFLLSQPAGPNEMERALAGRKPAAAAAADGRFSIEDLAQGAPVHLAVRAPGYLPALVRAVRPPSVRPVLVRLEPAFALAGQVVDEAGGPVSGARVDLEWQAFLPEEPDLPLGDPILRSTRTNGQGRFELQGFPAGDARLSVAAPAFVPLRDLEVALPRPSTAGELRLVLERGAVLQGRVTTAAGEPVPSVRVGIGGTAAATDDDGLYWLEGADLGRQTVLFFHASHGQVAKPFAIQPGVNVLDLAFAPGFDIAGRVVDEDGKPVPAARVELAPDNRFEPSVYRDVTGEDGRFRLSQVRSGRYRLKAGADGFADTERPGTLTVDGDPVSNLEVVLDRGTVLSGRILGLPAADLPQVEVEALSDQGERLAAWTDGRGRYEIRSLAAGDWTVRATLWDDQRQARTRVVIRRSDRELTRDLEFEKRLALTVQLLYDEEPLPEALISLRGQGITGERTATTDHEGRVRFEDLAAATYHIGLRHTRNLLVHNDQVDLQQDRDLILRLQGATVGGLVVSAADGKPIQDAMLLLRPVEGPEYLITTGSKSDGRFMAHRVQPNRYRVVANAKGFLQAEQEVQVASGETVDNLELRLEPAPGARVRVQLASGRVPPLVHVQVRDAAGRTTLSESQQVDATGEIELSALPPGSWTLFLRADGSALTTASLVVPSAEPLAVTLAPAGTLHVRVPAAVTSDLTGTVRLLRPDQQPFWTLAPGGGVLQQWSLVGGKAAVEGVPAGTWLLQVEMPDGQRWHGTATTSGAGDASVTLE